MLRLMLYFLVISSIAFSSCPYGCGDPEYDDEISNVADVICKYLIEKKLFKGFVDPYFYSEISNNVPFIYEGKVYLKGYKHNKSRIDYFSYDKEDGIRHYLDAPKVEVEVVWEYSNYNQPIFDQESYFSSDKTFSNSEEFKLTDYTSYLTLADAIRKNLQDIFNVRNEINHEEATQLQKGLKILQTYTGKDGYILHLDKEGFQQPYRYSKARDFLLRRY